MALEEKFKVVSNRQLAWSAFTFEFKLHKEGPGQCKSVSFVHPLVPVNVFHLVVEQLNKCCSVGLSCPYWPSPRPAVRLVCNGELIYLANPLKKITDLYEKESKTFWLKKSYKLKKPEMPLCIEVTLYYSTKNILSKILLGSDFDDRVFDYKTFLNLKQSEGLQDFKLISSDGQILEAHRLVLAAQSSYFDDIFSADERLESLSLNSTSFTTLQNVRPLIYEQSVNLHKFTHAQASAMLEFAHQYKFSSIQRSLEYLIASRINEETLPCIEQLLTVPSEIINTAVNEFNKMSKSKMKSSSGTSTFEFEWNLDVPLTCKSESFAHPCVPDDTFFIEMKCSSLKNDSVKQEIRTKLIREKAHSACPRIRFICHGMRVCDRQLTSTSGNEVLISHRFGWPRLGSPLKPPFIVILSITYPLTEIPSRYLEPQLEDELNQYFHSLTALTTDSLTDLSIKPFDERPVLVHALVFAVRSLHFRWLFSRIWAIRTLVKLDCSSDVLQNALAFIYDRVDIYDYLQIDEACELFKFAYRYQFGRIIKTLEWTIASRVDNESLCLIKALLLDVKNDVIKNAVEAFENRLLRSTVKF